MKPDEQLLLFCFSLTHPPMIPFSLSLNTFGLIVCCCWLKLAQASQHCCYLEKEHWSVSELLSCLICTNRESKTITNFVSELVETALISKRYFILSKHEVKLTFCIIHIIPPQTPCHLYPLLRDWVDLIGEMNKGLSCYLLHNKCEKKTFFDICWL